MTARICPARPEHVPAIAAVHDRCFSDVWPEGMAERMRGRFLVAEDAGAAVGYIMLSRVLDEGSVDSIAVAPEYRRRGAADALMREAIRRGRETGLALITLEVRAGNAPAIALYGKHGFLEAGRRKNYYIRPREDAILMTLVL